MVTLRSSKALLIPLSMALGCMSGCSADSDLADELDTAESDGEAGSSGSGSSGFETVVRWNSNAFSALAGTNAFEVFRGIAMVHIAMHDGANAVNGVYKRYALGSVNGSGADAALAAAAAARDVLVSLRPDQQASLDAKLQTDINRVWGSQKRTRSLQVGAAAAQAIIARRSGDGMFDVVPYAPADPPEPGRYQFTPGVTAAACPQCPFIEPFALASGDAARAPAPPALSGAEWAASYNAVKDLGRVDSTTRTADQTHQAQFFIENIQFTWNRAARDVATRRRKSLNDTARAFAMMNVAVFDATVASWDSKYHYDFWRPLTAIRAGDTDGNDATEPDPTWSPLNGTPGHPEYTTGSQAVSQAAALALIDTYGNSGFTLASTTPAPSGSTRSFSSFLDLSFEAGQSRIFGGIHYPFSVDAALDQGDSVGSAVLGLAAWERANDDDDDDDD